MSRAEDIPLSYIVGRIRKFSQRALLLAISRLAAGLDGKPKRMEEVVIPKFIGSHVIHQESLLATHSLAVLTRITLAHGNQWARREPTDDDVARLDNWVRQLPPFRGTQPLGSKPSGTNTEALRESFFQLSYDQFPLQRHNDNRDIGRSLLLFETIPHMMKDEGKPISTDIGESFREIWGMTLRQFMVTGYIVYAQNQAQTGKAMRIKEFNRLLDNDLPGVWRGNESDLPTSASFERFLQIYALGCDEFRQKIGDLTKDDERFVRVEKWPLHAYPIVRLGKNEILAPIPKMLIDRITNGVFHDIANHFKGAGGVNSFRADFGHIFERYVGYNLELVFPREYLVPETQYQAAKQTRSTPDWTINSPDGAIAIECRSSSFRLDTRTFADMQRITKDLVRIATDPLIKGAGKISDLKKNMAFPLKSANDVRFGICTFERLHPLGLFGAILADEITSAIEEGFQFYIAQLVELERICAFKDPSLFIQFIDTLTFDEGWRDPLSEVHKRLNNPTSRTPTSSILRDKADEFIELFGELGFSK